MMNELLAIILIVLLCCFLFFAWLFALATCPDRMVNLISGTKQSSSPISRASEDLLGGGDEKPGDDATGDEEEENGGGKGDKRVLVDRPASKNGRPPHLLVRSRSIPSSRSAGLLAQLTSDKRSNSKKLSVVPEADEQLTVTSISQCLRPPHLSNNFGGTPRSPTANKELPQQLLSAVKTVLLNRNPSNRSAVSASVVDVEEGGTGGDGGGGEASSSARSSKIETDDGEEEEQEESDGKAQQPTEANDESKSETDKKKEDQQQQKSQQSPQQKSSAQISIDEDDEEEDGQEQEQLAVLARRSAPPAIHLV